MTLNFHFVTENSVFVTSCIHILNFIFSLLLSRTENWAKLRDWHIVRPLFATNEKSIALGLWFDNRPIACDSYQWQACHG